MRKVLGGDWTGDAVVPEIRFAGLAMSGAGSILSWVDIDDGHGTPHDGHLTFASPGREQEHHGLDTVGERLSHPGVCSRVASGRETRAASHLIDSHPDALQHAEAFEPSLLLSFCRPPALLCVRLDHDLSSPRPCVAIFSFLLLSRLSQGIGCIHQSGRAKTPWP